MRADVKKVGEVVVVSIEGMLEIEETQPFREACLSKLLSEKVVFIMRQASFVGSTGLQPFLDTLTRLDKSNSHGLKLVGLKPEFKRVISSLEPNRISFHDDLGDAVKSFSRPPIEEKPIVISEMPEIDDTLEDVIPETT